MKAHCSSHGIEEAAASRVPPSGAVSLSTLGGVALTRLLDAMPVALEASTLGGQVIYANAALERVTERTLSEIVRGPALWSLDHRVAAAATEAIRGGADWMGTVQAAGDRRLPVTLLPLRGPDGSVTGCLCIVRTGEGLVADERSVDGVAAGGGGASACGVLASHGGRRAPAADLRALAHEHAATMLLTTDAAGRIELANPEWQARTGFSSNELVGRSVDAFLHPLPGDAAGAVSWGAAPGTELPYRCQRRDGTSFEVLVTTSRSMVAAEMDGRSGLGGSRSLVHAVARHATAGSSSEHPPADSARRFEFLGRMAAGIAHDFNNMLGVITTHAELALRRSQPGEPVRDAVLQIHEAAQRSARLTRQLLGLRRSGAAGHEGCELNAMVTGLEGVLRSTIGEAGSLRLELGGGVLPVSVSREEIEQVLVNLVANARDALRPGGEILVRTRAESLGTVATAAGLVAGQPCVLLEVVNSGGGIPQAVAARAFEPFFTTKEEQAGSGLGLAIIRGIVQHAGGVVSFRAGEPGGATVEVRLPLGTAAVAAPPTPRLRRSIRILVVDDEAPVRRAVARLVTGAGFHAIAAADGAEALAILEKEPIDLLLTDVVMPGMSGVALAALVAERFPRTAIVFMSGYAHDAITEHGLDSTKVPYLQKPFTRLELVRWVERTLKLAVADDAR